MCKAIYQYSNSLQQIILPTRFQKEKKKRCSSVDHSLLTLWQIEFSKWRCSPAIHHHHHREVTVKLKVDRDNTCLHHRVLDLQSLTDSSPLLLTASSSSCLSSARPVRTLTSSPRWATVSSWHGASSCRRPAGTAACPFSCAASGSARATSAPSALLCRRPSAAAAQGSGSWRRRGHGHDHDHGLTHDTITKEHLKNVLSVHVELEKKSGF